MTWKYPNLQNKINVHVMDFYVFFSLVIDGFVFLHCIIIIAQCHYSQPASKHCFYNTSIILEQHKFSG